MVAELKRLAKAQFDEDAIIETAGELKYTREIKRLLAEQFTEPDEEFVRFFTSRVYSGRFTKSVKEQFEGIARRAFRQFLTDQVNERLKSALQREEPSEEPTAAASQAVESPGDDEGWVETTPEETEGFLIIRGILRQVVDGSRVVMRDVHTYCGVLLDDNNRKPLARLHFNTGSWRLGLFDNADKREDRVPLSTLDDIYNYADRLRATPAFYEESTDSTRP